jgi:hypothetical protein
MDDHPGASADPLRKKHGASRMRLIVPGPGVIGPPEFA